MSISAKTLHKISNGTSTGKCPGRVPDEPYTSETGTVTHLYFTTDMYCLVSTQIDAIFLRPKVLSLLSNEK